MEDKKVELEFSDSDLDKVRVGGEEKFKSLLEGGPILYHNGNLHIVDDGGEEFKSALKDGGITVYPGGLPSSAFTERYARGELPSIEDLASLSPTQNYPGARPFRDMSTNPHIAKSPMQSYLEQTPPPPTVQNLSPQELTTCVSNAIATGLEKAITGVLKSPELSSFIEGLTRSKGILGVMQGLATHSGRNALDARTMDQNALEIFHLMDKAIEATKSRLQEKASGVELDPEIKDAEKEFQEYLARLENDKGIS